MDKKTGIDQLVSLVAALRGENGCPWDRKQTVQSMTVYLLEETYELVEAINAGDPGAICEELGDVLFLIVFVAHLFREQGSFDISDVVSHIHEKMVRRHPHVFGENTLETAEEVKKQWNEIKNNEKSNSSNMSVLDSVPIGLPALMRAYRISERAAANGFDWNSLTGVMEKVQEEWQELKNELAKEPFANQTGNAVSMEFGDLLFALVNVARFARIHPETALADAIMKFKKRFMHMEMAIRAEGKTLSNVPQPEKDALWDKAKVLIF
ncbi:MAG: nucleoside triphosphate pyrophosphohydrolase [Desulfobacterales bacterium]|jgi:tetrapyrrole methylase family protein/MazG family protein|nr:nucleoside triphosphate pyrophosphohydrolase [Desulfobacterales bacterium]